MMMFKIALASMLIVCGFHESESATFEWTSKPTCPLHIPENTPINSLYNFTGGPSTATNYTVLALNGTSVRGFSITANATLRTQKPFNYEIPLDRAFVLNITATNGTDNATVTCTIAITDVNDESPTFTKAVYFVSVKNNTPKGDSILNVTATDADVNSTFNTLTYKIKKEPNSDKFAIDANGAITAAAILTVSSAQNYTITVEAWDTMNTGTASVTVCVGCQMEDGAVATRTSLLALVTMLLSLVVL